MNRLSIIIPGLIGVLIAAGAGAYMAYIDNDYDFAFVRSAENLSQSRLYEDVIIQRYEPSENAVYALMYFRTIRDFILVRLTISPDFIIRRQDAIIVDDVIVGATDIRYASTSELVLGMQAAAVLRLTENGSYMLDYLLIGDPFPRP